MERLFTETDKPNQTLFVIQKTEKGFENRKKHSNNNNRQKSTDQTNSFYYYDHINSHYTFVHNADHCFLIVKIEPFVLRRGKPSWMGIKTT